MMICKEDRHCDLCDGSCPSFMHVISEDELAYYKDVIFRLIVRYCHPDLKSDGQWYYYDYCTSDLEHAFDALGIVDDYIELYEFCKMWEENERILWTGRIHPLVGPTAKERYEMIVHDTEQYNKLMEDEYD